MNEDRGPSRQSFLSRVFAGNAEGEGTAIYSAEEVGTGVSGRGQGDSS